MIKFSNAEMSDILAKAKQRMNDYEEPDDKSSPNDDADEDEIITGQKDDGSEEIYRQFEEAFKEYEETQDEDSNVETSEPISSEEFCKDDEPSKESEGKEESEIIIPVKGRDANGNTFSYFCDEDGNTYDNTKEGRKKYKKNKSHRATKKRQSRENVEQSARDVYKNGGHSMPTNQKQLEEMINAICKEKLSEMSEENKRLREELAKKNAEERPEREARNKQRRESDEKILNTGKFIVNGREVEPKKYESTIIKHKKCNAKTMHNPDFVTMLVTKAFLDQFSRANTITVHDATVFIDTVEWFPTFAEEHLKMLPPNDRGYFEEGKMAYFINWKVLLNALKPVALSIDDADLAYGVVATQLHDHGGRTGAVTFFNKLPFLKYLEISGTKIDREHLDDKEAYGKMRKTSDKVYRKYALLGGLQLSPCVATSSLWGWQRDNIKRYATSRGQKGIIRYLGGLGARVGFGAVFGALNVGSHLIKGIAGAFKPVSEEEAYKQ